MTEWYTARLILEAGNFPTKPRATVARPKIPATPNTLQSSDFPSAARLSEMDKKEIESPKLTANFLLWIGLFLLAMFLLIAHFAWHLF